MLRKIVEFVGRTAADVEQELQRLVAWSRDDTDVKPHPSEDPEFDRIDIVDWRDLHHWATRFNATPYDVVAAIEAVGPLVGAVREFLSSRA